MFTMASLTQLEAVAKIPVLTELKANNREFQAVIRVKQPDISWAINEWLTTPVLSCIKPTWKNLLLVLRLIHLDSIADQIVVHLSEKEGKGIGCWSRELRMIAFMLLVLAHVLQGKMTLFMNQITVL